MRSSMLHPRTRSRILFLAAAILQLQLATGCAASGARLDSAELGSGRESYAPSLAATGSSADMAIEYPAHEADVSEESRRMFAAPIDSAPGGGSTTQPALPSPEPVADGAPASAHGRQIVYTAEMQVSVFNVEDTMKKAEALPETYGGWIQTRNEGYVQMKIPARRLREAMDELAKWGRVDRKSLQASDVTAEYVDLESRIRVLRSTQAQLLELLTRSKTVEETLNVRKALDQVTMELEVALGRMRQLESQIAFSTLTLVLAEQGPHLPNPSSNDPFPWVDMLGVEATEYN